MTDVNFGHWKLVIVGAGTALLGLIVMTCCNQMKDRLVKQALRGKEVPVPHAIRHLWTEIGLGILLVAGVFFFSMLCFVQEVAARISFLSAYGASVLCGIGCFLRTREGMNALGLTKDESAIPEPVAVFPEEHKFLAILVVFSCALTVFLVGLVTLGWSAFQFVIRNS
ncbi:MAG: hypothetical protein II943_09940 [Victivallales bacterium]|nr:hypothetical protein [Victivallales bacterium]